MVIPSLVKVPIYRLHLWLSKAHSESPVYGSMLLAGVLMKLGLYGMLILFFCKRVLKDIYILQVLVVIFTLGVLFSCFISSRQYDLKYYIAYSSIVHMRVSIFFLFTFLDQAYIGVLVVALGHAFVSCGLFLYANTLYNGRKTRKMKIVVATNKAKKILFFLCVFNTSVPLTLSFLGEVCLFKNLIYLNLFMCIPVFVFFSGFLSIWFFVSISSNKTYKTKSL